MVAALEYLEAQATEETRRVDARWSLRWIVLALVFVTLAAALGWSLTLWLSASK